MGKPQGTDISESTQNRMEEAVGREDVPRTAHEKDQRLMLEKLLSGRGSCECEGSGRRGEWAGTDRLTA